MVELFENDIEMLSRHSSKGNQLKWKKDDSWYKADFTGYEGLSEYVVSQLLKKSSLMDEEYVVYDLEQIKYKTQVFNGVKSNHFLEEGFQIITLERLFKNQFGVSLTKTLSEIHDYKERLLFLVEKTERITGIKNFGEYICKLMTVDALFLNEDRHMHNIAVLMDGEGKFKLCPIFDNGAALLSDTTVDYPIKYSTDEMNNSDDLDLYKLMKMVSPKTICNDFDMQLDAAENLYLSQLRFSFDEKDINQIVDNAIIYSKEIRDRVKEILYLQRRKYEYLFI